MRRLATAAVGLVTLVAVVGPTVTSSSPTRPVGLPYTAATGAHLLGTDVLGRDVLVRVLHGGWAVVGLAAGATAAASIVGVTLGVFAGMAPARVGEPIVRVVDVAAAVPSLLIILVLAAGFPGSDLAVLVAVAIVSTPFSVRINRAATEHVIRRGFVEIARARGDRWWQVLRRDVAPNISGPALAEAGLRFVGALYLTSTAGFLGLGRGGPAPNWGRMVAENLGGASLTSWPVVVPALLLVTMAVSVNLLADDLAARISGR